MPFVSARALLLGSAAALSLSAAPAFAQENAATSPAVPDNQKTQAEAAHGTDNAIIVTARRRSEVLLNVPIAVTAFSGEQLDRQGAIDITDLGETTPNVTFEASRGTNSTLTAFIRGVGQQDPVAGFEQGVGIYLDDVYLNRPQAALLDIYDVQRIEVLRGPQGTLYGRNTIGGAIKYVTRPLPDIPELRVRANLGTYRQADLVLTASTPISEALRVGASVARLSRGGFGKNLTTGQDNYNKDIFAGRGTVEFEPTQSILFRLSGDYTWDNSNPRGGHRLIPGLASGAPVLGDVFDSRGAIVDPTQRVKGGGMALHGEIGLNDWLKFRTITAYRKDKSATPIDFDALPAVDVDVPAIYRNRQFSQEFQLVADRGPLQGVAGFYYLNANASDIFDVRLYTTVPGLGFTAATSGDVDTKTWAVFGDFTYDFTPQWSLSLGGRYTNDKRHAKVFRQSYILGGSPELGGSDGFDVGTPFGAPTSNFEGRRTDRAFTPRASISFKPNPSNNIYVSYAKGFKGGGFDPRGQSTSAPVQTPAGIYDYMAFDPEKVDSYELGWKASLFQHRLQLATAIFDAEYKDVQVPASVGCLDAAGNPSFCGETTNAGKARFRGVEFEGNARIAEDMATPGDRLNFSTSVGYLDAKYLHFLTLETVDQAGNPFPGGAREVDMAPFREIQNTPKWTASGSLDYNTPAWGGRLDANTTLSYRSKSQQFETRIPELDQGGFALLDANFVWRSGNGRYEVGLHGKNLTNNKYITSGYNFLAQDPYTGQFLRDANGKLISTLGTEGVLTAYYGSPRQVWISFGLNF